MRIKLLDRLRDCDPAAFELCGQVCDGVRPQLAELDEILQPQAR
jgi:hypothetical protein